MKSKYRIEGNCPHCGESFREANIVVGKEGNGPKPGDLALCMGCGAPLVILPGGLRILTEEEWGQLPAHVARRIKSDSDAVQLMSKNWSSQVGHA